MVTTFEDDIFKSIFMDEQLYISIRNSLTCVPKGPINDKAASVQEMAWRQKSGKPLPEPILTQFTDAYRWQ